MTASPPRATVRLQLHKDYTLDDARDQVDYHAALGISHYYLSPIFMARPGSTHGYDVIDFNQVNPELGGEDALRRLVAALREVDMGLVIDIVPNHMGVGAGMGGAGNAWWLDVLERGQASAWSSAFDIDWTAPGLGGKLLLPILGQPYGESLDAGELQLDLDVVASRFQLRHLETCLPLSPDSSADLLQRAGGLVDGRLTEASQPDAVLAQFAVTTPEGRERLHGLLERQHYRLAWWRTAADAINWRRFFEITDLAGLRMERPNVFDAVHAMVFRLYRDGLIDGVRVDHVDGLADPAGYCDALRQRLEALHDERPAELRSGAPWIVLEKILADDEHLRADWPVDGTTGYDFMNDATGVLHDPAGETALTALWNLAVLRTDDFATEAVRARRQILTQNLDSEFNALVRRLATLAQSSWRTRDITAPLIQRALEALLDHVPVYRTYMTAPGQRSEDDEALLQRALTGARTTLRAADHVALDHLDEWLGSRRLEPDAPPEADAAVASRPASRPIVADDLTAMQTATITKFQQLTSPLAAKAVEDTAFYRYGRLLSLNEVGGDPGRFGLSVDAFHARSAHAQRHHPRRLLATATHDHKRGEDSRARLAVLSECPRRWAEAVARWRLAATALRTTVDGHAAPSAADELMLYQSLVGAWPLGLSADDAGGMSTLIERVVQWQEKSVREAKLLSSWVAPNADYEDACHAYLRGLATTPADDRPDAPSILAGVADFVEALSPAAAVNGLTQTVLRLTSPGVPDLYQGTELWDWSLVDPDNRRPVDYAARREALRSSAAPDALLATWRDGTIKQAVVRRALQLRAAQPAVFADGDYLPLTVTGERSAHVIAYARRLADQAVVVVLPRVAHALLDGRDTPLVDTAAWGDTAVELPSDLSHVGAWRDCFVDLTLASTDGRIRIGDVLARWPVALLEAGGTASTAVPPRASSAGAQDAPDTDVNGDASVPTSAADRRDREPVLV